MYICVCKAITERDIRFAVDSGCTSFRRVSMELGVGTSCGRCKQDTCRVIREHKTAMNGTGALVGAD